MRYNVHWCDFLCTFTRAWTCACGYIVYMHLIIAVMFSANFTPSQRIVEVSWFAIYHERLRVGLLSTAFLIFLNTGLAPPSNELYVHHMIHDWCIGDRGFEGWVVRYFFLNSSTPSAGQAHFKAKLESWTNLSLKVVVCVFAVWRCMHVAYNQTECKCTYASFY